MWINRLAGTVWNWPRALGVGILSAIVVGVPTDVIDTPYFTRMIPVRWWDYPILIATVVLTTLWAGIRTSRRGKESSNGVLGTSVVSALAVGCPICNKIVVGLLGVSGALSIWAPIQPVLAVLSVAALLAAVIVRWRRRDCDDASCTPETRDTDQSPVNTAPEATAHPTLQTPADVVATVGPEVR